MWRRKPGDNEDREELKLEHIRVFTAPPAEHSSRNSKANEELQELVSIVLSV